MSPMCHCNETFLSFIEIDELQEIAYEKGLIPYIPYQKMK